MRDRHRGLQQRRTESCEERRHPQFHFFLFFFLSFLSSVDSFKKRRLQRGGLTEFHMDVLVRVFLPELFILVFVAHEWEDDLLANGLGEVEWCRMPLLIRTVHNYNVSTVQRRDKAHQLKINKIK